MSLQRIFLLGFLFLLRSIAPCSGESQTCLAVYKEGGAPAVFQSPKCPRWTLVVDNRRGPPLDCQAAMHQGLRRSQEDRVVCSLGLRIPFLGGQGTKEIDVGIVAVFDGHNGAEASDMASRLLLDYFLLHLYFILDGLYSKVLKRSKDTVMYKGQNMGLQVVNLDEVYNSAYFDSKWPNWISPATFEGPFHLNILKESLLRTIHDIDTTFSKEAFKNKLESGSTATVLLIADGQILAANVGDSKALLCSETFLPHDKKGNILSSNRQRRKKEALFPIKGYGHLKLAEYDRPQFLVKELTVDHHPDREDERNRVEAAGGYVIDWAGVLRVNGELAISRAIGDVAFKTYGVISTPEVTDWFYITSNDSYLVAASDGIFEKMTTQEVCDLLWYEKLRNWKSESVSSTKHSLADLLVNSAVERGTTDNMAAVVVPLGSTSTFQSFVQNEYELGGSSGSLLDVHEGSYKKLGNDATSILSMEYFNQIALKFKRLLVESKYRSLGCFYLYENLDNHMDYIFRPPEEHNKAAVDNMYHTSVRPDIQFHSGWPLELFNLCWYFGIHGGDKGQCANPESFSKFLGLLDSIPYCDIRSNTTEETFGYKIPRYVLKRRFDHGSFGEVWLAFHWNCSEGSSTYMHEHKNLSHFDPFNCNISTHTNSSNEHCSSNQSDGNLFILKRIMVERGTNVYLSGLREKYFGELFLNASMSLEGLTVTELRKSFLKDVQFNLPNLFQKSMPSTDETSNLAYPMSPCAKSSETMPVNHEEGLQHIARYVEAFESESKEIWLVFRNEGISLSKLIYTAEEAKAFSNDTRDENISNVQILHPSTWWHWLRTTEAGQNAMKNLVRQLLMALKACHDRNITHRDIKPENMIICLEDVDSGRCLREIPKGEKQHHLKMRIIDFGSAMDDFTVKHLYGSGPTRSEQTFEYAPPEALLNASWFQGAKSLTMKYDMWSVGVVMLELILGSPHVFEISDLTRALLDQHFEGWSEHIKELAYKLRSYMEMCILIPGTSPLHGLSSSNKYHGGFWPASWRCSEESFALQVKNRDPLKLGFQDVWAMRLVRQLLVWHPEDRLSVDEALNHPYFNF